VHPIKRNESIFAVHSDSAYCYTFLRSVVCPSVVCHVYVPCSTVWRVDATSREHLWAQWHIVLDMVSDPKERFEGQTPVKACNCALLLPPDDRKRGVIPLFIKLLCFLLLFIIFTILPRVLANKTVHWRSGQHQSACVVTYQLSGRSLASIIAAPLPDFQRRYALINYVMHTWSAAVARFTVEILQLGWSSLWVLFPTGWALINSQSSV